MFTQDVRLTSEDEQVLRLVLLPDLRRPKPRRDTFRPPPPPPEDPAPAPPPPPLAPLLYGPVWICEKSSERYFL